MESVFFLLYMIRNGGMPHVTVNIGNTKVIYSETLADLGICYMPVGRIIFR